MSAAFAEVRIDDALIVRGTVGGPMFSTTVVATQSGAENRDAKWTLPLGSWDLGERDMPPADARAIKAFFIARRGKAQGFRFRDWLDYTDEGAGVLLPIVGSTTTMQMWKAYASGSDTTMRKVSKPVALTVQVLRDGVPVSGQVFDSTTGIVTIAAGGVLTWTGQFDMPVRFETDQLRAEVIGTDASGLGAGKVRNVYARLNSLPIVELRL